MGFWLKLSAAIGAFHPLPLIGVAPAGAEPPLVGLMLPTGLIAVVRHVPSGPLSLIGRAQLGCNWTAVGWRSPQPRAILLHHTQS